MITFTRKLIAILTILSFTVVLFGCNQKDSDTDSGNYPAAQLSQSPGTYRDESSDGVFTISAPNYYGEALIGGTMMYTGTAFSSFDLSDPFEGKQNSTKDVGYGYQLFITEDGTLELGVSFNAGTDSEISSAVFGVNQNGNDVTFTPGTITKRSGAFMQKVSGIFAVEVYKKYTTDDGICKSEIEGTSLCFGIVLSNKEVDEFFATGKIANYSGFDFSGLNDIIGTVGTDKTTKATNNAENSEADYPLVQLKQSPTLYVKDPWGDKAFVTSAPNYYGNAVIGKAYTVEKSALSNISAVGNFSATKDDAGYGYMLFITEDGFLDITFAFKETDEDINAKYRSAAFKIVRNGNEVTFATGTPEEHSNEFTQRVSGIFAVEVMADRNSGTTNDMLWGIVLSQKEVDEFFATGKIAKYNDFDLSGINDILSV